MAGDVGKQSGRRTGKKLSLMDAGTILDHFPFKFVLSFGTSQALKGMSRLRTKLARRDVAAAQLLVLGDRHEVIRSVREALSDEGFVGPDRDREPGVEPGCEVIRCFIGLSGWRDMLSALLTVRIPLSTGGEQTVQIRSLTAEGLVWWHAADKMLTRACSRIASRLAVRSMETTPLLDARRAHR